MYLYINIPLLQTCIRKYKINIYSQWYISCFIVKLFGEWICSLLKEHKHDNCVTRAQNWQFCNIFMKNVTKFNIFMKNVIKLPLTTSFSLFDKLNDHILSYLKHWLWEKREKECIHAKNIIIFHHLLYFTSRIVLNHSY